MSGLWQPAGAHDAQTADLWAVVADIQRRLTGVIAEVHRLNEEWEEHHGDEVPRS